MRKVIIVFLLLLSLGGFSQNIILNPGFENGPVVTAQDQVDHADYWSRGCATHLYGYDNQYYIGSSDLFDANADPNTWSACPVWVPENKWAYRNVRATGDRYVGFATGNGIPDVNGNITYGESVLGTLEAPLIQDCPYIISAYACAIDGQNMHCTSLSPIVWPVDPATTIEAVLRVAGNCNLEKVVTLTGNPFSTNWQQYSGTVVLTAADIAIGFNRIEFRTTPGAERIVFLDDVSMQSEEIVINTDFSMDPHYCYCGNIHLTSAANTYPVYHQWYIYESDQSGSQIGAQTLISSSSTCDVNTCILDDNRYYTVKHGCWWGCAPWTETRKTFYLEAIPNANAGKDKTICEGESVQLGPRKGCAVDPNDPITYSWTPAIGLSATDICKPFASPTTTTVYTVYATCSHGCSNSDIVTVYVDHYFDAEITGTLPTACNNNVVLTTDDVPNASYQWSPGGQTTSSITVNPTSTTTYTVTVSNTCTTITDSYTVEPIPQLYGPFPVSDLIYPNAFTPNGNVTGDNYIIWNLGLASGVTPAYNATGYELSIFSEWGSLFYNETVTTLDGLYNGQIYWDGTSQINYTCTWWERVFEGCNDLTSGQVVPEDTYIWNLRLMNCNNDEEVIFGNYVIVLPSVKNGLKSSMLSEESEEVSFIDYETEMAICPNPSSTGVFAITANNQSVCNIVTVELFDYAGKKIWSNNKYILNSDKIDISNKPNGIYFVKIITGGNIYTEKIIKQ